MSKKYFSPSYFAGHLYMVIGMVLIWRGIWLVLDGIDYWLFDGYSGWTGTLGVAIGVLMLYLPDKDLKEIEKI